MGQQWTLTDPRWLALSSRDRAVLMSLMEANTGPAQFESARNALGAMINRADKAGVDIGKQVGTRKYQPSFTKAQQTRIPRLLKNENFSKLQKIYNQRLAGEIPDPVDGATHFLAHPKKMLALERSNPAKYKNWGLRGKNWSGYDPKTGRYANQTISDCSHSFLAPEGKHSAFFWV